ncbi:hypothetical protein K505DRAFT_357324 [Melanomma pulvis-pyrius CBS 109.77]|uniref:Uncharacterized protein n=1 Tax=Melanomma pulvis-pyrius CBS 109.77 TaxID=1314802 RepID=A0A6A6XQ42_9PLEO|nr:hypothetical protein K505DRAFT_357324 [Melanomma pulvis-pyrius CBS 109.77]
MWRSIVILTALILSILELIAAAPAVTSEPEWKAVKNAAGATLPDPKYHPYMDPETCIECTITRTIYKPSVTFYGDDLTLVLGLTETTLITRKSPTPTPNPTPERWLTFEWEHERRNCYSPWRGHDLPESCAPRIWRRPAPSPKAPKPLHDFGDADENNPNPYRLTSLELANYGPGSGIHCFPRNGTMGLHRNIGISSVRQAAKTHCAVAAQEYGVKDGMIQFQPSNVTDYLNFNAGWKRYTYFNDYQSEYVQISVRQGFGLQGSITNRVYPISERTCRSMLLSTAEKCSNPGEDGSGVSIYNGEIVMEMDSRYLTEAERPEVPEFLAYANPGYTLSSITAGHPPSSPITAVTGPVSYVSAPRTRSRSLQPTRSSTHGAHYAATPTHGEPAPPSIPMPTLVRWTPEWFNHSLNAPRGSLFVSIDREMPIYNAGSTELKAFVEWYDAMLKAGRAKGTILVPVRTDWGALGMLYTTRYSVSYDLVPPNHHS